MAEEVLYLVPAEVDVPAVLVVRVFVDLVADCLVLSGRFDSLLWPYVLLVLAGMIVLLACEDNGFPRKLNLVTLGMILAGAFSIHL